MGIVIKRARHQQEGEQIKETTMPIELQKGTEAEQACNEFTGYPFDGYHKFRPADVLKGNNGSPYSRQYTCDGRIVSCGINWFERHTQRLDVQLRATGEPVALLRRKWTGERCPRCGKDGRTNRGNYRCPLCFGTCFVGGYVRYINTREPDGKIFIRVSPTQEDLTLEDMGLHQEFNPQAWTLPCPILRDWDVIIRYDPRTCEETWRYEVTNVTRNKGFFSISTAQTFTLNRVDKTDILYDVRQVDLDDNLVGRLEGDHDSEDALQTQIENRFGQGHNDGGFSEAYEIGFNQGFADGLADRDFHDLYDTNSDATWDNPYGNLRDVPEDKKAWLFGFRCGYFDGFQHGQECRRQEGGPLHSGEGYGNQVSTPPRDIDDTRTVSDPPPPLRTYDTLKRNPQRWQ